LKFKFNLEKILTHRKNIENLAQKDFGEAQHLLNIEIEKINKMIRDVQDAQAERQQVTSTGGQVSGNLQQVHDFLIGQEIRINRQKETIKRHQSLVEEKRQILLNASKEYKIIEKLKEKRFHSFKQEANYREQVRADDLATMRFGRNKDGAGES
jgi:flagellar protein FliJ